MKRNKISPRKNMADQLEKLGFGYQTTEEGEYWIEDAYYAFEEAEIETIEKATTELWQMSLDAVDSALEQGRFDVFRIPKEHQQFVMESWESEEPYLYGRFDFGFDGKSLKMFEFNADTPTSLYEASVLQWDWLNDVFPNKDQFNSIHEQLLSEFKYLLSEHGTTQMHFASFLDNIEDATTTEYLRDCAAQAGIITFKMDIRDIGWNGEDFTDTYEMPIKHIFKLYPWEHMLSDEFGANLRNARTKWIEPVWKSLLSNKALLPLLWEKYPNHPYLLESRFDGPKHMKNYVRKPIFSREGANVQIYKDGALEQETIGDYGAEGHIYQELYSIPVFDGYYPIIGSWTIGGVACGIGIRESNSRITDNYARFVPHIIN